MQSTQKRQRFGCLSSPCSPISYQNRNKRRISIHGYTSNHRSRLSRACIPVFPILCLPRLLSPLYIVTSLLAPISAPRCQTLRFTLIATTRFPALVTVPTQSLLQWAPQILRHLHHPNARPLISILLLSPGLRSPLPFSRDGPRVPAWSLL